MISFTNPCKSVEFDKWPNGDKSSECYFAIEEKDKGIRFTRVIGKGKPKYSAYGGHCCYVDGDDGHLYCLQRGKDYSFIKILGHDFIDATYKITGINGFVSAIKNKELYEKLNNLINRTWNGK